jgi:acyl-homoserine-lactone acylase
MAAAFDPFMPAFARMIPMLVLAYDAAPSSPEKTRLADPVGELRAWDFRWGRDSVATTLAVSWGEEVVRRCAAADARGGAAAAFACAWAGAPSLGSPLVESLAAAVDRLERDIGTWRVPWGEVNRFQRRTGNVVQVYADDAPSTPVPFTPGVWGSLASFATVTPPGLHRRYGTSGNSFVAVVELTPEGPHAVAVTAGGESGDPRSPHFLDQAERYASGRLRPVYFRPADLAGHVERVYRPGQR